MTIATGKYQDWLTDDGLLLLESYARDGLTDEQISEKIGIRPGTLYEWKNRFPEISEAIKKGKAPVDTKVENALLKSALGHVVKVRKPIKLRTRKQLKDKGLIEEERIEYAEEEVYIPPQTAAQIFWLKNRRPDVWREKPVDTAVSPSEERTDDALTAALREEAVKLENGGENENG